MLRGVPSWALRAALGNAGAKMERVDGYRGLTLNQLAKRRVKAV